MEPAYEHVERLVARFVREFTLELSVLAALCLAVAAHHILYRRLYGSGLALFVLALTLAARILRARKTPLPARCPAGHLPDADLSGPEFEKFIRALTRCFTAELSLLAGLSFALGIYYLVKADLVVIGLLLLAFSCIPAARVIDALRR